MKITFLCGSLEPGRDGVGDYTRKLAIELIRNGHQVGIVALNDKHLKSKFNGLQQLEGFDIPVLRVASNEIPAKRFHQASSWIDDFGPDWLSLQFVPFSFHTKGLAFGLGKLLEGLGKEKRWHIMVHELWVGMEKGAPLKFVCWGWLQKQLIGSLFSRLQPAVVHTQTDLYMKMLAQMGFTVQHLPLFGNIEKARIDSENGSAYLPASGISKNISFVVFGGIHPGAPISQLAKELKFYGTTNNVKVEMRMIGRCGYEQESWKKACEAAGLLVKVLGEQSPEHISHVLTNSSFGISTTPTALIGKSGSVAAMQEHGLPVLCVSRLWQPRGFVDPKLPDGIMRYKEGQIQDFITRSRSGIAPRVNVTVIARQFVNSLLSV
ncbi:MAG: glycosyltransferase family 1 protein [Ferruginibacter sp.]|nr:glycosyltransferase family 1 protein [Ferruginibacter sp.]